MCSFQLTYARESLLVLHQFVIANGSVTVTRHLLSETVWQARELGLHREKSASTYPSQDRVDILFFLTTFNDTSYSTLCGKTPFLPLGESDVQFYLNPINVLTDTKINPTSRARPLLVQAASLRAEFLDDIHSGQVDTLTEDFILAAESKLSMWMQMYRAEQGRLGHPSASTFSNIYFHW